MERISKGFALIVEKAEELESEGYLKAFKTDLTNHDRAALEKCLDSMPFLWAVRDTGTWILTKDDFLDPSHTRNLVKSCYHAVESFFVNDHHKLFHYNGNELVEIKTAEEGTKILRHWYYNF